MDPRKSRLFGSTALILLLAACGEDRVTEPQPSTEGPRLDHIPVGSSGFIPAFIRSEDDSTETITVTFEGCPSTACFVDHVEGVTFGVPTVGDPSGFPWIDDSLWVAYPRDSTATVGAFYLNHPSPTTMARMHRSYTGEIFFDPPVRHVRYYYCLESTTHYAYAYNALGGLVDWAYGPPENSVVGGKCTAWDSVSVQVSSDVIAKLRISADALPVIDDLSFTRRIRPDIECLSDPGGQPTVDRSQRVMCRITADSVESVDEWHFEMAADSIHIVSMSSAMTWSGTAVLSGDVWAVITRAGNSDTLRGSLQVKDRSNPVLWRWSESKWDPFQRDDPPLPNCEQYGVFHVGVGTSLGRHRRNDSCRGGFIDPDVGLEGGVEDGFDAVRVTGGGPNEGLWYVQAAHYTMDNASSVNPFLKPGYTPPDTLDPQKVKKNCQNALGYSGSGPLTASFYDYNTECGRIDPFLEGNIGDRILDHEGEGTNGWDAAQPNGHEARLRQAAELEENDPYKAVEKLVDLTQELLGKKVEEAILTLDTALSDAADPFHFYVKDNFGANGNCGKAHVYNSDSLRYQFVPVYQDTLGRCI